MRLHWAMANLLRRESLLAGRRAWTEVGWRGLRWEDPRRAGSALWRISLFQCLPWQL